MHKGVAVAVAGHDRFAPANAAQHLSLGSAQSTTVSLDELADDPGVGVLADIPRGIKRLLPKRRLQERDEHHLDSIQWTGLSIPQERSSKKNKFSSKYFDFGNCQLLKLFKIS